MSISTHYQIKNNKIKGFINKIDTILCSQILFLHLTLFTNKFLKPELQKS